MKNLSPSNTHFAAHLLPSSPAIRYDMRVIISFLGFAAFCVLNWIAFAIRSLSTPPEQKLHMFSQHMGTFLVASYVFYPSLSLMQLKVRGIDTRR